MISRTKTRIKFLDRTDIDLLIGAARNPLETALMHTLFSTGLRVSECVSLLREPLENQIKTTELSIIGKGGWMRTVYFSPPALAAISSYTAVRTDKDPRLFPVTKRTVERVVERAAASVKLKATPHTFRHSFATHVLRETGNIRLTQELLGHRSISSTQIYAGVTSKDLMNAHQKLF